MDSRKYGVSKKWAASIVEGYMKTPEYQKDKEQWDKEFQDYVLFGIKPEALEAKLIDELLDFKLQQKQ